MRSSIAKVTSAAFLAGVVLLGAAGTAAAHECRHFPHDALAVGGDAIDIGDDATALAVGGDAIAIGSDEKGEKGEKGDRDERGAEALAVGGDATAIGEDASALAVGGDAIAIGKDHKDDEDCD